MVCNCLSGGMAEWLKAAVLKTVERKLRGFESYSLRQENFFHLWPVAASEWPDYIAL